MAMCDKSVALLTIPLHILLANLPRVTVLRFDATSRRWGILHTQQNRTATLRRIRTSVIATTTRTILQLPITIICAQITLPTNRIELLFRPTTIIRCVIATFRVQCGVFRCLPLQIRKGFSATLAASITQISTSKKGIGASIGGWLGVIQAVHAAGCSRLKSRQTRKCGSRGSHGDRKSGTARLHSRRARSSRTA